MVERALPELARNSKIIRFSSATEAIRLAAEGNPDDKYRDFRARANFIEDKIKEQLFPDVWTPNHKFDMPKPPVAIEDMRNYKTLATYRIVPDGFGLNDKLTLNEVWMVEKKGKWEWVFGEQALVETIVHEMMHERMKYLVKIGKMKPMADAHAKPFRDALLALGIHCNKNGQHTQSCDDPNSPVGVLLKRLSIPMLPEPMVTVGTHWWISKDVRGENDKKGRSTLTLWTCECIPPQRVRVGKGELFATCTVCDMPFTRKP